MSRFSDFFAENIEQVEDLFAYAPSKRFKEKVKNCKAIKAFNYEERGINPDADEIVQIAEQYIKKYVEAGAIEVNPKSEFYLKRIDWQFSTIPTKTAQDLRKKCEKTREVKKGYYQKFTDYDEYMINMILECVKYPNLNNAELQDSYGVSSAESLLCELIPLDGELSSIKEFVNKINGYDDELEDKREEAKNS